MLRISNIKLHIGLKEESLTEKVCRILKISKKDIRSFSISKKSIDARNKEDIFYIYSVDLEIENEDRFKDIKNVKIMEKNIYVLESPQKLPKKRPVIVGSGPCGVFAALILAQAGRRPIIIERGKKVSERKKDVDDFFQTGSLNENSNVQFGEGGAGTFSDGKLTTGINDPRINKVLKEFVRFSAPEEILYDAKPHIGTDRLYFVMENMRKEIESLGGEYRFSSRLSEIITEENKLKALEIEDLIRLEKYIIETNICILAIGHSARDTFKMLYDKGIFMEQKVFSVGLRIEHKRIDIDKSQYGKFHKDLPAADYKLNTKIPRGRGAYTFCMCPGGVVVAAASEKNSVVTNGMSYYKRDLENSNSALLVNVGPGDFSDNNPLAGVLFQQKLEKEAFIYGGENYKAPCQLTGDFLNNIKSTEIYEVLPTYKPGVTLGNFNLWLPEFVSFGIKTAIKDMDKRLKGFAKYESLLTGIESRSSSPVRILRNESHQSNITGLYPAGEGAGYAGGIMSAAVDGIKCAEMVINGV